MVNELAAILPILQQEPTPVVKLISAAIKPNTFTFNDVLSIRPSVDFIAGLTTPVAVINLVTLELLAKAASTTSDAAIVAGQPGVVLALVRLWLCTTETGVAQNALEVLWSLLEVDYKSQYAEPGIEVENGGNSNIAHGDGQGLVWRRLFGDRDIYEQLFSVCSLRTAGQPDQPSKRHKTVAQARLMDLIPRVARLDWDTVSASRFPDVESKYGVKEGGLLKFAAFHMVDVADDILMHVTLIDFFTELLGLFSTAQLRVSESANDLRPLRAGSPSLDFLIKHGLHQRTASYYLEPDRHDAIEVTYINSKAGNYLAVYATCYPNHLLNSSPPNAESILARLSRALNISSSQWTRNTDLQHHLHVLASLPRVTLIPFPNNANNPLLQIPLKPANSVGLRTMATIFHGPEEPSPGAADSDADLTSRRSEAAAARLLYFCYLQLHPYFWVQLVETAEIIALKENALAAIALMSAIITANWETLPRDQISTTTSGDQPTQATNRFFLPTEQQVTEMIGLPNNRLAPSGILTVLKSPAVDSILPYLLRPAQTFSNLVGGRGDAESAAYKIAVAKYDLLKCFHDRLSLEGVDGFQDVSTAIRRRLAEGPMSRDSEVGGRIGTLEL